MASITPLIFPTLNDIIKNTHAYYTEDTVLTIRKRAGIITVIMLITSIVISIMALPAASANIDYSAPGATNKTTLSASDILSMLFADEGFAITDEERAYLDKYSGESITYSPILPSGNIKSEYDVQEMRLTVTAKKYTYTSLSGVKAEWIPARVICGDASLPLEYNSQSGEYSASINGIEEGAVSSVTVTFAADFTFSEETLNSLLTKAYGDAVLWERYAKYLSELEEYSERLAQYKQYLIDQRIYDDKYFEYQTYLSEKAEYDEAKALFDKYEIDLAKYNTDYALFVKYLAEKESYDKNQRAYEEYVKNYTAVKAQLAVIDGIDKGLPTIGRPLRGAILGPTVTEVINNKDAIANEATGVDGSVIDLAGESTEMLRELFEGYFSKKEEADKYIYYSLNYEKFRDAFTNLLSSLDYLYQNGKVKFALGEMDMTWKFQILLAQLYYVVVALNDSPVMRYDGSGYFDSSYRIEKKKPITYVENVEYVKDPGVATPISGGYPAKVEKPTEPVEVVEPTKPTPVTKPIAPTEIKNPGDAPIPVTRPDVPSPVTAPDKRLAPDGVLSEDVVALLSALADGKLTQRDKVVGERTLTLTAEAVKSVHKVDEITVHFYDADGSLLESVTAERGGYVEYGGRIPEKLADGKLYTFVGWQTADGIPLDMSCVNPSGKELSAYPLFTEKTKVFTVTWRIENTTVTEEYEYGAIPSYKGTPTKEREGASKFVFAGWNKDLTAVTSDTTYVARFNEIPLVVDKNGTGAGIDLETDTERYIIDCSENAGVKFDLSDIFSLAAENMKGITVRFRGGAVILSFSELMDAYGAGATVMSLMSASATGDGEGASFKLTLTAPDGTVPDKALRATVGIYAKISSLEATILSRLIGGERVAVPATISEDGLRAQVDAGEVYQTYREFGLSTVPYADINLAVDKPVAAPGDIIRVSFSAPADKRVVKLYYIDGAGNKTVIEGGAFVMPEDSVTVGLEFEYIKYTVRFTSDGRVIHTATYTPGEMPYFPGIPAKAADSEYSYTFIGWDMEFSPVDGNAVYNAVYEKTPIIRDEPQEGLIITPRVLKIILLVATAAFYGGLVALPCVIIVTVKLVRRCLRRLPRGAKSTK